LRESEARELVHALHQLVDHLFPVSSITSLGEVDPLVLPSSKGIVELERPQEVIGSFEVGPTRVNFMNQILHADDVVLPKIVNNELVVRQRHSLPVNLSIASLVDQLANGFQSWLSIGHIRLNVRQHGHCGRVHLEEHSVVQLKQTEQLQDLPRFGSHTHDTTDSDNQ